MESFGAQFSSIDHYRDHNNPIIAKAVWRSYTRAVSRMSRANLLLTYNAKRFGTK
jgi:hypothetical protein